MSFELDIHCDACGNTLYYCSHTNVPTKGFMIRQARKSGWSVGKYHLCPECKKNISKLKKEGMI